MGCRRDLPSSSFRVGHNVFARYFLVVELADGDLRPFSVARVVTNSNPDPGSYYIMASSRMYFIKSFPSVMALSFIFISIDVQL
jgi:hypothetical protein